MGWLLPPILPRLTPNVKLATAIARGELETTRL